MKSYKYQNRKIKLETKYKQNTPGISILKSHFDTQNGLAQCFIST